MTPPASQPPTVPGAFPTLDMTGAASPAQAGAPEWAETLAAALALAAGRRGEGLLVKDAASGRIALAGGSMGAWLGRDAAALEGMTDAELFDAPTLSVLRAADQAALAHDGPLELEHRLRLGGGRLDVQVLRLASPEHAGRRWICSVWSDLRSQRQREVQLQAVLEQLEREQRANERLRRELADQALRDADSGLHKRTHFEEQLRREADLSVREHREFAIVIIQPDPLAERYLPMGDAAQAAVVEGMGRLLREGTRVMDSSCRLDAHRFAVLLSGVGLATAHTRMEGLRRQCATQVVVHEGQELQFTVSIGVASFPHTAQTCDEVLEASERALLAAQGRGGNQIALAAIPFETS